MSTPSLVKTRFLILSDSHSALPDPINRPDFPWSHPFPEADVAIHAGDLTSTGKIQEHQRALSLLKSLPAPVKLVIPGNHDLTLDRSYCEKHPVLYSWLHPHTEHDLNTAEELYTNDDAIAAGILFVTEGSRAIVLPNGAKLTIYASPYTPEFCDWGFAYPPHVDRFNIGEGNTPVNPVPDCNSKWRHNGPEEVGPVTVMITHGPPKGILDRTTRDENVGCDHLFRAVERCKPLIHCFGHIHEAWGMEVKSWISDSIPVIPVKPHENSFESKQLISNEVDMDTARSPVDGSSEVRKRHLLTKFEKFFQSTVHPLITEAVPDTNPAQNPISGHQQSTSYAYHDATSAKHGQETVFINASIMSVRYRPIQKPWVVDLMLPTASEKVEVGVRPSNSTHSA